MAKKAAKKKKRRLKTAKKPKITLDWVRTCLKNNRTDICIRHLLAQSDQEFVVKYILAYLNKSKFSAYTKALQSFSLVVTQYIKTKDTAKINDYLNKLGRMSNVPELHYRQLGRIQESLLRYICTKKYTQALYAIEEIVWVESGLTATPEHNLRFQSNMKSIIADLAAHKWKNGVTLQVLYGQK